VRASLTLLEEYYWLLCREGLAESALADVDHRLKLLRDGQPAHRTTLTFHKARVLIALKRWDDARKLLTTLVEDVSDGRLPMYHSAVFSQAWQMLGFVHAEQGNLDAAQQAWKNGLTKSWGRAPTFAAMGGTTSFMVSQLIMGSLVNELDDTLAEQIHKFLTKSLGGNEQSAQFVAGLGTPTKEYRRMWQTPRGREWARRITFRDCSFTDYVQVPVLLLLHTGLTDRTFAAPPTAQQDELLWQFCRLMTDTYSNGDIGMPEVLQLALTWQGTTNALGWSGVAPKLSKPLRAQAAYFVAIRFKRLKRDNDVENFLQTVRTDAEPDSSLLKLAAEIQSEPNIPEK
jgi:hypothetical protein